MARKFLYLVAAIIMLVIAGGFVIRIYERELTQLAFVPTTKFEEQKALATTIYDDPARWFARGRSDAQNVTRWQPKGSPAIDIPGPAAIFFIHPTSYLKRDHWNAPLDDQDANWRALLFVRGMASTLAGAGDVAPVGPEAHIVARGTAGAGSLEGHERGTARRLHLQPQLVQQGRQQLCWRDADDEGDQGAAVGHDADDLPPQGTGDGTAWAQRGRNVFRIPGGRRPPAQRMQAIGWRLCTPSALATPGWQTAPLIVFSPDTSSGRSVTASTRPRPAIARM